MNMLSHCVVLSMIFISFMVSYGSVFMDIDPSDNTTSYHTSPVDIRRIGDPILNTPSRSVTIDEILYDPTVKMAIAEGHATLLDFRSKYGFGRAIAAPQFGYNLRIVCVNIDGPVTMINPVITHKSDETFMMWGK
mmetsp:Transcript_20686/g.29717  ORF Transcript_20686/g.29717 Transcript_20686/m.29717 type:complete len:135 (-) Transcript_20686:506-910(-)